MNIYEKLASIMGNVNYLRKDDHVVFGQTNYKALSEEKVTSIMREQMVTYGLLVFPVEMSHSRTGNLSHVDVKYRIVNAENPEEFIEVVSCGDGADTQDKGAGKAMTYAYKYMWLRTFGIPTGEDPDKISSDQLDAEERERKQKETQHEARYAARAAEEEKLKAKRMTPPAEPKKATVTKSASVSDHRNAICKQLMADMATDLKGFKTAYSTLRAGKKIDDVDMAEMNDAQFDAMVTAMRANFVRAN